MPKHRFFIDAELSAGDSASLSERESHHALHVLRLTAGTLVALTNGRGTQYQARITELQRNTALVEILEALHQPRPTFKVALHQAIVKPKAMDLLIQKATELGATHIQPLHSENCRLSAGPKERAKWVQKWRLVAIDAIKQCQSNWAPEILPVKTVSSIVTELPTENRIRFVGDLTENSIPLRELLQTKRSPNETQPLTGIDIFIGPEGDFSRNEKEVLKKEGVQGVSFGSHVLRAETAAVFALSAVTYQFSH